MKPEFALFGATGAIGASIISVLRQQGVRYRVVGRDGAALQRVYGADPLAETRTWDPGDVVSIAAAAQGVDTLIYMVGVPYDQFHLHPYLMRQTIEGAVAAGVKRLLLIGTLYPFGRPQTPRIDEQHPREPHTFKGRMRQEQEDILMEAHRLGRIEASILRLPDFYGPGVERSFLDGVFKAIATGKAVQMIGPIDIPHEFVYVPDVGPVAVKLAREPRAYGRGWNLGGAGVITQRDFAWQAFALAGKGKPRLQVAGKFLLRVLGLFNPFMRELVEMRYLLTSPLVVDDSALEELLGGLPKTSYEDGIREILNVK